MTRTKAEVFQTALDSFHDATGSPEDAMAVLFEIAQRMREDASELTATWGSDYGARPWIALAEGIDYAIRRCERTLPNRH